MSEHRKGPWLIDPDDRPDMEWNNHIVDQHGNAVCFMAHSGGKHPDQDQANAHLIAAAPDLLAACQRAKKLLEQEVTKEPDRKIFWELVDAIAKAEGRTT